MKHLIYLNFLLIFICTACLSNSTETEESDQSDLDGTLTESTCGFEDGTHSATVVYYNPETNFTATYTLDVEVQDCQVVQIDFQNGGWLDDDHISPAEIDSDGDASVEGEDGKTYEVHL